MQVRLIYDGAGPVRNPAEMGKPRHDQLAGTPHEQLCELAGRVCYDSLGQGRDSACYHEHIHEVKHYSVYEHAGVTVALPVDDVPRAIALLAATRGRPGVSARLSGQKIELRANYRALLEWDRWTAPAETALADAAERAYATCLHHAMLAGPWIVAPCRAGEAPSQPANAVENSTDAHHQWVTLFLQASRGWSHEMVRHGDGTAISQRSTRYVDEADTPWETHPLVTAWLAEAGLSEPSDALSDDWPVPTARRGYVRLVEELQAWLVKRGASRFTARKQARGAARGLLGNALQTEMVFSASVAQWRWMLSQRGSAAADGEFRRVFVGCEPGEPCVLTALRKSRYAAAFADVQVARAEDGLLAIVEDGQS